MRRSLGRKNLALPAKASRKEAADKPDVIQTTRHESYPSMT
jgi:hypothetical protein